MGRGWAGGAHKTEKQKLGIDLLSLFEESETILTRREGGRARERLLNRPATRTGGEESSVFRWERAFLGVFSNIWRLPHTNDCTIHEQPIPLSGRLYQCKPCRSVGRITSPPEIAFLRRATFIFVRSPSLRPSGLFLTLQATLLLLLRAQRGGQRCVGSGSWNAPKGEASVRFQHTYHHST